MCACFISNYSRVFTDCLTYWCPPNLETQHWNPEEFYAIALMIFFFPWFLLMKSFPPFFLVLELKARAFFHSAIIWEDFFCIQFLFLSTFPLLFIGYFCPTFGIFVLYFNASTIFLVYHIVIFKSWLSFLLFLSFLLILACFYLCDPIISSIVHVH